MIKNNSRESFSIINIIIFMFIFVLLITVSGIGYIVFSNWASSAKHIVNNIAEDMNQDIYYKIEMFMNVPVKINEVNHKLIENDILDLPDEEAREKFFTGVLSSYSKEIYSFSFGTVNGEYYGARRNENGIIEIMRNNADTDGNSWYYSVTEDLTAGEMVVSAGKFDPRTRDWYKAAEQSKSPMFSPVYKHFVMDDLTVSYAYPVYDDNGELLGVLGTHILLSDIGFYLEELVLNNHGYACIIEGDTGNLIGNSQKAENFTVLADGTLKRYTLGDLNNADIEQAYMKYKQEHNSDFLYEGENENLFVNVEEYHKEGIDWVIISAVPENLLMSEITHNIMLTVFLSIIAVLLSMAIYYAITNRLFKPMLSLLKVSDNIASGNFSDRAVIVRNDEIGKISKAFNKVADYLHFLINNLEETVKIRTIELEESKGQLQLILDSTAEAIYGIDLDGSCTFCNISCLNMLGYKSQDDLLGKNMHMQIHHSHSDGSLFPVEDCKVFQSIRQGIGTHSDDEVFWKSDGAPFEVEYYSYPQIKNGKVIGAVITFMDINERKKREEKIKYLSCHDSLTGLHNRRCFEDELKALDISDNLPLSVIFADINGLKLTNDIFGHSAGDTLIKKSSEILKQCCRESDAIARVGGDEFIMLLPKTNSEDVKKILSRIKSGFSEARVAAIKCSISLGSDTKTSSNQSIADIVSEAENEMYKDKTLNRKSTNFEIINTLIETLHTKSLREKQHAIAVGELCSELGAALNLSDADIKILKKAGYLHDIGKVVLDDSILHKDILTEEEHEKMQQHSAVGYRILNLFDNTVDLSEIVYAHHERWDGKGYPRGLKGEEIPLLSRIISIVEVYERVINGEDNSESGKKAVKVIRDGAGTQFDPKIADIFVNMIESDGRQ